VTPVERADTRSRWRLLTAGVIAGVLVLTMGLAGGWMLASRGADPSSSSVEVGFARDMQTHHDQAVEMALIVRDRTDDPEIRSLAYDIATSQAQQSGQMYAWLNDWGVPQARPGRAMEWMAAPTVDEGADSGHAHATQEPTSSSSEVAGASAMPGMASEADLERLRGASGTDAEIIFLTLMIAHHRGGVDMADAVLDRSTHPLVTTLARTIVFAQSGEIDYMESLLEQRSS